MKLQISASDEMKNCIERCFEVQSICIDTMNYCLKKGEEHTEATHLKAMQDCIEACRVSADFMLRDSSLHEALCGFCAQACEACEESCRQMADDPQMKKCADACKECGDLCREMSGEGSIRKDRFSRGESRETRI